MDNDADLLVDLADVECMSNSDDSESIGPVPPGPLEPPPVTVTPADIGVTEDTTPTVEFSSTMPGVRYACVVQYRPDNGSSPIKEVVNPCTSPYTTPPLHNGKWEITITGMNPSLRASTEVKRRLTVAAPGAPTARVAYACSGRVCYFNGLGSSDPDGSIASYRWDFSDGTSASGGYVRKEFIGGASSARLTVTDDTGAGGYTEQWFTLLNLTGRAFMSGGFPTVELSWNGTPGALYWIYRGSKRVGAIVGTKLIDRPPASTSGAFPYAVCSATGDMCSATETFSLPAAGR